MTPSTQAYFCCTAAYVFHVVHLRVALDNSGVIMALVPMKNNIILVGGGMNVEALVCHQRPKSTYNYCKMCNFSQKEDKPSNQLQASRGSNEYSSITLNHDALT
jgi:hypothetical protein